MKCEEALTKIEAYINHTLNGRELEEFLEHVTSCQDDFGVIQQLPTGENGIIMCVSQERR